MQILKQVLVSYELLRNFGSKWWALMNIMKGKNVIFPHILTVAKIT